MKNVLLFFMVLLSADILGQSNQVQNDWGNLAKYAAGNRNLKTTAKEKKRVVFMGDSITEFWKVFDNSFFADKPYVNRGISGQTTPQMLLRFRQDVIDLKPALVVILAGINDIAENAGPITVEAIFNNIVSMAESAKKNKIGVALCSVLPAYDFSWRRGLQPAEKIIKLNAMISTYARKHKIIYVDYYPAMVDERKGLNKRFSDDGVHPTTAGYKIMEPILEKAIAVALKK